MGIIVLAYLFCGNVQERRFSYEIILEIYDLMWKFDIVPLDAELGLKLGLVLSQFLQNTIQVQNILNKFKILEIIMS